MQQLPLLPLLPLLQAATLPGAPLGPFPFGLTSGLQPRQPHPLVHPGHYNTYSPYLTYSLGRPFLPYTPNRRFSPYARYSPDGLSLEGLEDPAINGWPSSSLALPPTQYEDCIFLWYFCTDHVAPGWPANRAKCQRLLAYCANYLDSKDRGNFFTQNLVTSDQQPPATVTDSAAKEDQSETAIREV